MTTRTKTVTRKLEQDKLTRRENQDLKQEVRSLKKQIARMRKQLAKQILHTGEEELEVSPPPLTKEESAEVDDMQVKCNQCGSPNLTEFKTPGGKKLIGCRDCKARL